VWAQGIIRRIPNSVSRGQSGNARIILLDNGHKESLDGQSSRPRTQPVARSKRVTRRRCGLSLPLLQQLVCVVICSHVFWKIVLASYVFSCLTVSARWALLVLFIIYFILRRQRPLTRVSFLITVLVYRVYGRLSYHTSKRSNLDGPRSRPCLRLFQHGLSTQIVCTRTWTI